MPFGLFLRSARPEIKTLAFALRISDPAERSTYLRGAFQRLEELETFVDFVQAGVAYFQDGGITVRSNLPYEHQAKMRDILREATDMKQFYLG